MSKGGLAVLKELQSASEKHKVYWHDNASILANTFWPDRSTAFAVYVCVLDIYNQLPKLGGVVIANFLEETPLPPPLLQALQFVLTVQTVAT